MRQRYWIALGLLIGLGGVAVAQAPGFINQYNALCSASFPTRCVAVTAAGEVPISGSISATSAATATVAAPSYVEGTSNPLSQDLGGALRVTGSISATSSATATAAAPTYVEGTSNAISQNLTGDQRVIAKQSGTWTNTVTQATGTNLHAVLDSGTVTTITNPVTVTDGAGALNVIVDSGTLTAVTTITNPVTVTDGAGALNVIIDSGTTAVTNAGTFAVQPAGSVAFDGAAAAINPNLGGCYASAAAPTDVSADNDATRLWCLRNGATAVQPTYAGVLQTTGNGASGTGVPRVTIANDSTGILAGVTTITTLTNITNNNPSGSVAFDGAAAAVNPLLTGCYASAAAPTDVSADNDATREWCLRNGARAAVLTAAGALIGGDAANGLDVDVTRMSALVAGAAIIGKVGIDQTTPGTTNLVQVTDGSGALNVIVDSGAVTVTNATAANLKAEVVGNVTPADGLALGTTSVSVAARNGVYNGTTTDLQRSIVTGTNSTGTGIAAAGLVGQCDDTSPQAITENQFGNGRIDCATHGVLVTTIPSATAGGTTLYTLTLANSTNATNVKASAGQLYSISGFNISSATPVFISLYNNSGTPTCGTSIIQQFMIPGSTTGAGFVYDFATPKGFATGIAFCATTGIAGTGSAAASTYVLNIDYK